MALPTFTLEVSFNTGPFATPSWTDVSTYWYGGTFTSPSRSFELDQLEPGRGEMQLDNTDRRFEPEYVGGAFAGSIVPVTRFRVKAVHSGNTYYLWHGYVDSWEPSWQTPGDAEVRVSLVDALDILAGNYLSSSYSEEATGERIYHVLDTVGFPTADRAVDSGQSRISAKTFTTADDVSALQHIREALATEGPSAAFFVNGQGYAAFHDRHKRLKTPYTTSRATFGDAGSEIPYEVIRPSYGKDLIYNDARVTRSGGTTQTASDSTSQAAYGKRTRSISTLHISDVEPADLAYYIVSRYKDPLLRFDAIEVAPLESDTIWATVLSLAIGERITVKRRPPEHYDPASGLSPTGIPLSKECVIEGITWVFPTGQARDARVRYLLSPADINAYWTLGDAAQSLLGQTTKLAF